MKKIPYILVTVAALSCSTNPADPVIVAKKDFFTALQKNDVDLKPPVQGEWLYSHHEPGQSFESYKNANPIRPASKQSILYIKPIGQFSKDQKNIIENTAVYLSIVFGLPAKILPASNDNNFPDSVRRQRNGREQLLAPYLLNNVLKNKLPSNAMAIIAITEKDLYPKNDWNFVFGLASYQDRVAVCSIARLSAITKDSTNNSSCLSRLLKITSHETGHMLSLHHCINAKCAMNGSNTMQETDKQPNRFCSLCIKKLYWNIMFDNAKRLKDLQDYFLLHDLKYDYELAAADYNKINKP